MNNLILAPFRQCYYMIFLAQFLRNLAPTMCIYWVHVFIVVQTDIKPIGLVRLPITTLVKRRKYRIINHENNDKLASA